MLDLDTLSRPEYHKPEDVQRLLKNTLKDPDWGIRDHALLALLYGLPVRSIELIRLKTKDMCNDEGVITPDRKRELRGAVSFNGRARTFPVLDPLLIHAQQQWIDYRIENGLGVTSTGYIDLEAPYFLRGDGKGFHVAVGENPNGNVKNNAESINRVIRKRMADNGLTGSIDSALRTWTLDRHRAGADMRIIWAMRGDASIETVKKVIGRDPVRLGALVEKIY